MTSFTEIAPDVYRISTYEPKIDMQFIQFLVKDEEPLLFHTGLKGIFPNWVICKNYRGARGEINSDCKI